MSQQEVPAPFVIQPNGLYSRAALIELLQPLGIDPDAWIARIRPRKRFRQCWFGEDLLEAIRKAPELGEREGIDRLKIAPNRVKHRGRSLLPSTSALDAILKG